MQKKHRLAKDLGMIWKPILLSLTSKRSAILYPNFDFWKASNPSQSSDLHTNSRGAGPYADSICFRDGGLSVALYGLKKLCGKWLLFGNECVMILLG